MVTSFELIRAALFRACFWPPFQKSTGLGCFITQSQFSREEEAAWQAHGSLVKKNSWYAKLGWHGVRVFQLKKGIFEYWICVLVVPLSMVPSPCRQSSNKNKAAHVRWNISSSELQMHGPKFSSRGNPSISLSLSVYIKCIYTGHHGGWRKELRHGVSQPRPTCWGSLWKDTRQTPPETTALGEPFELLITEHHSYM